MAGDERPPTAPKSSSSRTAFGDITNRPDRSQAPPGGVQPSRPNASTGSTNNTSEDQSKPGSSNAATNPPQKSGAAAPPSQPSDSSPPNAETALQLVEQINQRWSSMDTGQKNEWFQQRFNGAQPPWTGEVPYDDSADIDYEDAMTSGRKPRDVPAASRNGPPTTSSQNRGP